MTTLREGELTFDFSRARRAVRLDDRGRRTPEGLSLVDFVVEEADRLLLVEVKDPSCASRRDDEGARNAMDKERERFLHKIRNDALISDELTPKARDSYTWLHLMRQDGKPIVYAFFLGADQLPAVDSALLMRLRERLQARILHEAEEPWARPYVSACLVVTEKTWPLAFPDYPVRRLR